MGRRRGGADVRRSSRISRWRFVFRRGRSNRDSTFYTVRVAPEGEVERTFAAEPDVREATIANNTRQIAVNREGESYRVLYVGGRPNWEYKFLHRGVEEDPQIDLVGFLRIARREAKFDFRGRADESSNPLFRGFKKTGDEETESYDQPVIVRLGTKDAAELRDGFPQEKAELYAVRRAHSRRRRGRVFHARSVGAHRTVRFGARRRTDDARGAGHVSAWRLCADSGGRCAAGLSGPGGRRCSRWKLSSAADARGLARTVDAAAGQRSGREGAAGDDARCFVRSVASNPSSRRPA